MSWGNVANALTEGQPPTGQVDAYPRATLDALFHGARHRGRSTSCLVSYMRTSCTVALLMRRPASSRSVRSSNASLALSVPSSIRRLDPADVVLASRSAPRYLRAAPARSLICRAPALSPPSAAVRAARVSLVLPMMTLCAHD